MDGFPLFFATSGPTKRRKHDFCLLFSQYWTWSKRINVLLTSPRNQFRHYFIWNRIEKLMPQLWNCSPRTLKTFKQLTNLFSNLDFLQKYGFPKTLDLSMDFPRIFHGGRRPTKNVGGCGGGGSPPHEFSRPGSLGRAW